MSTQSDSSATHATVLSTLLTSERQRGGAGVPAGLSIRALAKRAGVSAAQLSRIESGQVAKPGPEVLTAIARALNRNPLPLLVVAGHIEGQRAQEELRSLFFREGAEVLEEWGDWTRFTLEETLDHLHAPECSEEDLVAIAADVFRVQESDETLWDSAYELLARGEDAAELRELVGIWRTAHGQRERILDFARAARKIADLGYLIEKEVAEREAELARVRGERKSEEASR